MRHELGEVAAALDRTSHALDKLSGTLQSVMDQAPTWLAILSGVTVACTMLVILFRK